MVWGGKDGDYIQCINWELRICMKGMQRKSGNTIPNHYGVLTFLKFDPCRIRMLLRYRPTQLAFTIFQFFFP